MIDGDRRALGAQLMDAAGAGPVSDVGGLARRLEAGTFFWLDMTGPSATEVMEFAAGLRLSEDASRHLLLTGQRAGLEVSGNDLRGVAFSAQPDEGSLAEVNAVYTASFLVTVHDSPCLALDEARQLYQHLRDRDQRDGPLVLFMVLDAMVASFQPVLARLDVALDELEASALSGVPAVDYLEQIGDIRRTLKSVVRALGPYRSDLEGVSVGGVDRLPGMGPGAQEYFTSHRNHALAVFEDARDCRDETKDVMQTYSSAAAEQQGRVMNLLTVAAAVFLPLSLVTGFFGMNFSVIANLHGWLSFTVLAVVLPSLLAIVSVFLVRRLIRRLGVHLRTPSQQAAWVDG